MPEAESVGEGSDVDSGHERAEAGAENALRRGHRHRADGSSVVRSLEDYDALLLRGVASELQGGFDGLGTGGREEIVERRGGGGGRGVVHGGILHDGAVESLNELHHGLVEPQVHLSVHQPSHLPLRRFDHFGVTVASVCHSYPRGEVEIPSAVRGSHVRARGGGEGQGGQVGDAGRQEGGRSDFGRGR